MKNKPMMWPNKLGYDIGEAEVWIHKDGFRVFTETRVLRVPYLITNNPETALTLCEAHGLLREALEDMPVHEAQAAYMLSGPQQKELF